MLNVIVASENMSKIKSVKMAFEQLSDEGLTIISLDLNQYKSFNEYDSIEFISNIGFMGAESNVSSKPLNDDVKLGAFNRLNNLQKYCLDNSFDYDYLISIEGGFLSLNNSYFLCTYAIVRNKENLDRIGLSSYTEITKNMYEYVKSGKSLNKVIESISGSKNNKANGGILSFLSDNKINRTVADSQAVMYALSPHLNKDKLDLIDKKLLSK